MSCKQKQTMLYLPTAIHSTMHGDSNKSFHIENTVRLSLGKWCLPQGLEYRILCTNVTSAYIDEYRTFRGAGLQLLIIQ